MLGSKYFVQNCLNYFPNGTLEFNLNSDDVGGDNVVNDATTLQQFDLFSPGTPREFGFTPNGSTNDTSPSRGVMIPVTARSPVEHFIRLVHPISRLLMSASIFLAIIAQALSEC